MKSFNSLGLAAAVTAAGLSISGCGDTPKYSAEATTEVRLADPHILVGSMKIPDLISDVAGVFGLGGDNTFIAYLRTMKMPIMEAQIRLSECNKPIDNLDEQSIEYVLGSLDSGKDARAEFPVQLSNGILCNKATLALPGNITVSEGDSSNNWSKTGDEGIAAYNVTVTQPTLTRSIEIEFDAVVPANQS